jgi:hypothetical protein
VCACVCNLAKVNTWDFRMSSFLTKAEYFDSVHGWVAGLFEADQSSPHGKTESSHLIGLAALFSQLLRFRI